MRLRAIAMGNDAGNLRLEQANAFAKIVDRQMVERFACQLAGQIPFWARAIVDIHFGRQCGAFVLAVNRACG